MKFLSYDSKFGQMLIKLCYGCCLNIVWFVCCLPGLYGELYCDK